MIGILIFTVSVIWVVFWVFWIFDSLDTIINDAEFLKGLFGFPIALLITLVTCFASLIVFPLIMLPHKKDSNDIHDI